MSETLEWDGDVTICKRYALSKEYIRHGPTSYIEWEVLKSRNFPAGGAPYKSIGRCGGRMDAKKKAQNDLNATPLVEKE
jgi:hypothetical protein